MGAAPIAHRQGFLDSGTLISAIGEAMAVLWYSLKLAAIDLALPKKISHPSPSHRPSRYIRLYLLPSGVHSIHQLSLSTAL